MVYGHNENQKRVGNGTQRHHPHLFKPYMKTFYTLWLMFMTAAAIAADGPYNEAADARLEIKNALRAATNTPIIVVFGANWCGDCKALDKAMKQGAAASLLGRDFRTIKVDVGRFDKNLDVARSYGVPLSNGIPAIAIISSTDKVLYVTRDGELADARKMGDDGIYQFFKHVTSSSTTRK
jgi:protein disulfide-isomerase